MVKRKGINWGKRAEERVEQPENVTVDEPVVAEAVVLESQEEPVMTFADQAGSIPTLTSRNSPA